MCAGIGLLEFGDDGLSAHSLVFILGAFIGGMSLSLMDAAPMQI